MISIQSNTDLHGKSDVQEILRTEDEEMESSARQKWKFDGTFVFHASENRDLL